MPLFDSAPIRASIQPLVPLLLLAAVRGGIVCEAGAEDTGTVPARRSLWAVPHDRGAVFLLGSIHVWDRDGQRPSDKAIEAAYAAAQTVVFETDLDALGSHELRTRMADISRLPDGESLSGCVSTETYELLGGWLEDSGLARDAYDRLRPQFAALRLIMRHFERLGFSSMYGVDRHFFDRAKRDGKSIIGLETPKQHIDLFTGLNAEEGEEFLRQALDGMKELGGMLKGVQDAWREGHVAKLAKLINDSFAGYPRIYDVFVRDRNAAWTETLCTMLENGQNALVVVGVGHLVGKDSLVQMLGKRGHKAVQSGAKQRLVEPSHVVSLRQAHKGSLEIDTLLLDSYGRLPEERRVFYLAAREVLTMSPGADLTDPRIITAARKAELPLVSGPMLGDVSDSAVTVWFRPVNAGALTVQVSAKEGSVGRDFGVECARPGEVVRVRLAGLPANTQFTYRIATSAGDILGRGSFRTAPKPDSEETIRIAFGSCFHKIGVHNPNVMRLIAERGNHAMLLLGDLAVDDREAKMNLHRADYLLRDVSKPWRTFSARIPVYASWDDHDYLNNDKSGRHKGQITDEERNSLRQLWQENWNNPLTDVEGRGIYFNTVIGDVEVIMLDTRSCRNWQERKQHGAYLGDAQMQWLLRTLKASEATFIILTSGTMWSDFMSKAKDSWGSWDIPGREELFDFIETNRIGGVLLLSGDRHGARGFRIERPSGFALHEFEAATLGGVPGPSAFAKDRSTQLFGYRGGLKAFGEFTFDMSKPDPEVTFRLIDEQGKELEKHTFTRSQLSPGG